MLRRRRSTPADPLAAVQPELLDPRWRQPVERMLAARRRFDELVASLADGATHERLGSLRDEISRAAIATWTTARQAQDLDRTLEHLDDTGARDRLKQARRRLAQLEDRGSSDEALAEARRDVELADQQFASINRMAGRLDDIAASLARVEQDVEASITLATEVALTPSGADPTTALAGVVGELTALQQAMTELDRL